MAFGAVPGFAPAEGSWFHGVAGALDAASEADAAVAERSAAVQKAADRAKITTTLAVPLVLVILLFGLPMLSRR